MKEKLITFLKANYIVWAYLGVSLLIELTGVCVTSGIFLIRNPLMFFSLLAIFSCVLFVIKSQRARYWCAFTVLTAHFAIDLVFIIVFEMTGSTFDYSMLKLRGDAMAIVESVPINFVFFAVSGIALSLYLILARYYLKKAPAPRRILPRGATAGIMAAVLALHAGTVYGQNYKYNPADLSYKLYSSGTATYFDNGIVGNFVGELYKGAFFSKVTLGDTQELDNFIYGSVSEPSPYFGTAKDYNVVTVLAESFEWFSFMRDLTEAGLTNAYPNGHGKYLPAMADAKTAAEEQDAFLRTLYPNLYTLYDTSVVGLNNHAREKTDISENQSIIGNYPTNCYVNYDYADNTIPYSVPNILRTLYGVSSYSFHNGEYNFYNRTVHHQNALGFVKFTASEDMAEEHPDVFFDYKADRQEHNLDDQMMRACAAEMFPADRRFNTMITSISMHGKYAYRSNLKQNYKTLFERGVADAFFAPEDLETVAELEQTYGNVWTDDLPQKAEETLKNTLDKADIFFHYAAAALEFDKSIGTMLSYLQNTVSEQAGKPLMDNTLIVLYGDHNVYYQSLGEQVKNIYMNDHEGRNFTDLYRVPLMVRIGNTGITDRIRKFTTTTDVVPTILDLLGIRYYDAINYGTSIFHADRESIIYSRAYNVFITDKLYFSSLSNIKYKSPDLTDADMESTKTRALTLLDKTSHVNRIFYYDYLSGEKAEEYYAKLIELNAAQ
ncbi:MAG: sulfatase-like hydrolase/transferase [Clostridia bacterium]|nr:sulfatase-like hydrolase/transferase [Clostridia bacterium]